MGSGIARLFKHTGKAVYVSGLLKHVHACIFSLSYKEWWTILARLHLKQHPKRRN